MLLLNELKLYLEEIKIPFNIMNLKSIFFDLKIYGANGKPEIFSLEVIEDKNIIKVREARNELPDFCPNRHINRGGFFCLGLLDNTTKNTPEMWLNLVKEFLKAQVFVSKYRCWSKKYGEWSHADAAYYQGRVEFNLEKLSKYGISLAVEKIEIVVKENKALPSNVYYHLFYDKKLLLLAFRGNQNSNELTYVYSSYGKSLHRYVEGNKVQCAKMVFYIAIDEYNRVTAEDNFWKDVKNAKLTCCNTMDKCEIR